MSSEYLFDNILNKWKTRYNEETPNTFCIWNNEKINIIESDEKLLKKYVNSFNTKHINCKKIIKYLHKKNDDMFNNLMFNQLTCIVVSDNLELVYNLYIEFKKKYSSKKILDDLLVCVVTNNETKEIFNSFFNGGTSKICIILVNRFTTDDFNKYNIISDSIPYENAFYITNNVDKIEHKSTVDNGYYVGICLKKKSIIDNINFEKYPQVKFKNLKKSDSGIVMVKQDGEKITVDSNCETMIETPNFNDLMKICNKKNVYLVNKKCYVKKNYIFENDGNVVYINKKTLLANNDENIINDIKKCLDT